jgi:hypothetical protein
MAAAPPRVKGLSLFHWMQSFERLYGRAVTDDLLARLAPDVAQIARLGFDATAWYPVEWYRSMCAAGRGATGEGLDTITRVARVSASSEFSGVHRVLVLFLSPQRLLRASARVFERYYTEGQVVCLARGKNGAEVRWSGCLGFDHNLWQDCWTATTVLIEMCGGKNVVMERMFGGHDGDEHATVVFYWQ